MGAADCAARSRLAYAETSRAKTRAPLHIPFRPPEQLAIGVVGCSGKERGRAMKSGAEPTGRFGMIGVEAVR